MTNHIKPNRIKRYSLISFLALLLFNVPVVRAQRTVSPEEKAFGNAYTALTIYCSGYAMTLLDIFVLPTKEAMEDELEYCKNTGIALKEATDSNYFSPKFFDHMTFRVQKLVVERSAEIRRLRGQ
jgi:hypothetical protein